MKKLALFFLILLFASTAFAYTIDTNAFLGTYLYGENGTTSSIGSGTYLGTVVGNDANDDIATVQAVLASIGINVTLTVSAKVEAPNTSQTNDSDFNLNLTYFDEGKSGEWATYLPVAPNPPGSGPYQILDFFTVKGGTSFALYMVPQLSYGTWNVGRLEPNQQGGLAELSHFSGYAQTPVPEPISMLLFGTGLVGVGGYVRRKFKK